MPHLCALPGSPATGLSRWGGYWRKGGIPEPTPESVFLSLALRSRMTAVVLRNFRIRGDSPAAQGRVCSVAQNNRICRSAPKRSPLLVYLERDRRCMRECARRGGHGNRGADRILAPATSAAATTSSTSAGSNKPGRSECCQQGKPQHDVSPSFESEPEHRNRCQQEWKSKLFAI